MPEESSRWPRPGELVVHWSTRCVGCPDPSGPAASSSGGRRWGRTEEDAGCPGPVAHDPTRAALPWARRPRCAPGRPRRPTPPPPPPCTSAGSTRASSRSSDPGSSGACTAGSASTRARSCWWRRGTGARAPTGWWASWPDRSTYPACTGRSCGGTGWWPPSPPSATWWCTGDGWWRRSGTGPRTGPAPGGAPNCWPSPSTGRPKVGAWGAPWSRRSWANWRSGPSTPPTWWSGPTTEAAVALYRRAGFEAVERFELHPGTESLLLQWDRPGPTDPRPAAP